MSLPRCCNTRNMNVTDARAAMHVAARKAARMGDTRPRYIDEANKAKAAYIQARAEQMAHQAQGCAQ